mmetsp:Transcript_28401/g.74972  ORF Transcript_28401/g.74972 Transcript_28401/m.74972 type:complete len:387 (+) Transcript_28401:456-1616(+)
MSGSSSSSYHVCSGTSFSTGRSVHFLLLAELLLSTVTARPPGSTAEVALVARCGRGFKAEPLPPPAFAFAALEEALVLGGRLMSGFFGLGGGAWVSSTSESSSFVELPLFGTGGGGAAFTGAETGKNGGGLFLTSATGGFATCTGTGGAFAFSGIGLFFTSAADDFATCKGTGGAFAVSGIGLCLSSTSAASGFATCKGTGGAFSGILTNSAHCANGGDFGTRHGGGFGTTDNSGGLFAAFLEGTGLSSFAIFARDCFEESFALFSAGSVVFTESLDASGARAIFANGTGAVLTPLFEGSLAIVWTFRTSDAFGSDVFATCTTSSDSLSEESARPENPVFEKCFCNEDTGAAFDSADFALAAFFSFFFSFFFCAFLRLASASPSAG